RASRADWARATLRLAGLDVPVVDISADEWPRASTPPRWAVLEPGPLPPGLAMRSWSDALAAYLAPGPA
ncbi:MAG: dTDP-4-dehydrorhamnose reductase, partial [Chloroflexota bacterium]